MVPFNGSSLLPGLHTHMAIERTALETTLFAIAVLFSGIAAYEFLEVSMIKP